MPLHKIGQIVWKKSNAGFVGTSGRYLIPDIEENQPNQLFPDLYWYENEDCLEWNTLFELDENNNETGNMAYHVSDCQLELVNE